MNVATDFTRETVVRLLSSNQKDDQDNLLEKAYQAKVDTIGNKVYLRGLIEFSNRCRKNCLYCGIRSGNQRIQRYSLTDETILQLVDVAKKNHLKGLVLQAGERNDSDFTNRITTLITKILKVTDAGFRLTLSLGEQTPETYRKWFDAGAQRYLLRIETTNKALFKRIHPDDELHTYKTRMDCLEDLKKAGYQVGTGVMIGLPFQTLEDLADDLFFIREMDIDMVGMGPYLEHADTPLYQYKDSLLPLMDRFNLSLRMIAVLRMMMPDINIASTTALQAIVPMGREWGLKAGANVLMPNLTPARYRKSYLLYDNKPCLEDEAEDSIHCLTSRVGEIGEEIVFDDYGDSKHFITRKQK